MIETEPAARLRYRLSGRRAQEQDAFFEEALDKTLWEPAQGDDWDTCWHTGMPEREAFRGTGPTRTVNHIPGNNCLTIKSRLDRTMRAMRYRVASAYGEDHPLVRRAEFVPAVYSMPEDYHTLQADALARPDALWLLKPKNGARGRDIRLLEDVAEMPTDARWLVQEYLADPHLIDERKYVLRLYVLVSSVEPLRVYLYRQGFAKLASCRYTLADRSNPYIHQTNPDVNAHNTDTESPVVFIDLDRYRQWLREQGCDDERLFARIRDLVALTMIGAREPMRSASARREADTRGCYELIGLDCLVDADLNPWLLECNLSPSLGVCAAPQDGGTVEESVKRSLVADMVALLGLNQAQRQRVGATADAAALAAEADEELARAGGFERVYPVAEAECYFPFFAFPRRADWLLACHVAGREVQVPSARRWRATEVIADDRLSLYGGAEAGLYTPNPTAALIWLHASDGNEPERVARAVAEVAGVDPAIDAGAFEGIQQQVWEAIADWARDELLIQAGAEDGAVGETVPAATPDRSVQGEAVSQLDLVCGAQRIRLNCWSQPAFQRLEPLLQPLRQPPGEASDEELTIVRSRAGFSVVSDGGLVAEHLLLAGLGPWLVADLLRRSLLSMELGLPAAAVAFEGQAGAVLICREACDGDDRLALGRLDADGTQVSGGVRLDVSASGRAFDLGLPLRLAFDVEDASVSRSADGPDARWWYGRSGTLVPTQRIAPLDGLVIQAVLIACAEGAQSPQPVDLHSALGMLLPQTMQPGASALDHEAVARLASWLSQRPLYTVAADAGGEALARIAHDLGEQAVADPVG